MIRTVLPIDELVTGERLEALADRTVEPQSTRPLDEDLLDRAQVLYLHTHLLSDFTRLVWPHLRRESYTLITHNSDHEVGSEWEPWIDGAGPKLHRWFAQNVTIAHPKLAPLPIGIANSGWRHGDLQALQRAMKRISKRSKQKLLYVQFEPATHPGRPQVYEQLRQAFPGLPSTPRRARPHRSYLRHLAQHRFCACPRGNGIDTHRVWECLYLGVVPIVSRSVHTEHWQRIGLPLMLVDDWAEVTPARLDALPSRDLADHATAPLRLSHYARLIADSRHEHAH
jgi:hypothetical protein